MQKTARSLQCGLQHYSVLTHLVGLLRLDPLPAEQFITQLTRPRDAQGCAGAL